MTREEAKEKIIELEEQLEEAKDELQARPTNTVEVIQINEVVIENSAMGTEGIGELFGAMSQAQGEFDAIEKNSSGHGYDYADITAVLEATKVITCRNDISVVQMNVSKIVGKTVFTGVKTILGHKGGGWISSEIYMPTTKTKMNSMVQMAGVNITYLRRYGLQSALGLSTTDNDGSDK